ncbi:MAG: helix-turn-helix domain-containing protein [Polaromonas sp.]|uniref:helix-turn-helix domain-containing protein n=1 Tax=Polaromonas sp. TaxID=1869339 RepID=UPI002735E59D|nr:helix-turn-helix domain-containing protein [Polaromonas sp.]MDP2817417.1 helix-turn-helix domain-containing protein [Polaromonas sp.]
MTVLSATPACPPSLAGCCCACRPTPGLTSGDVTMAADARPVVPVSQEAMAMMLGMTRQTLSKELKVLVAEGAVALRYRRIEITSAARLKVLSDPSR